MEAVFIGRELKNSTRCLPTSSIAVCSRIRSSSSGENIFDTPPAGGQIRLPDDFQCQYGAADSQFS